MTSLEIRVQPWVTPAGGPDMDRWVTRRVEFRVEFVLDGRTVSDLGEADARPNTVTVFDLGDRKRAADVLRGRAALTDSFPPVGRLPLLLCPCGDPGEGTLTVRLSRTADTVTWDQWAWEHDSFPIEWLPDLPECRFPLDEYAAAVEEAGRLAATTEGKATSIIRVANHGDGIVRWIDRRVRGELAQQAEWLDVDVVHPGVEERSPGLGRLLVAVALMRSELAEARSGRRYVPTGDQAQRVVAAASEIVESPEAFRLPGQTLSAVEWLHGHLPAGNQLPREKGQYFDGVDPKQINSLVPGQFAILSAYFGAKQDTTPEALLDEIQRRCSELGMTHEHFAGTHVWQGFLEDPARQLAWFIEQELVICEVSED